MACQLFRRSLHQGRFGHFKCYSLLVRSYDESYDDSSAQAFLESIHTMTMMHRAPVSEAGIYLVLSRYTV